MMIVCYSRLLYEIVFNIFSYFDYNNHVNVSTVCKRWNRIYNNDYLSLNIKIVKLHASVI